MRRIESYKMGLIQRDSVWIRLRSSHPHQEVPRLLHIGTPMWESSESRVQLHPRDHHNSGHDIMPTGFIDEYTTWSRPRVCVGSKIIVHSPGHHTSPIRLWILSYRAQVHLSTTDKEVWWPMLRAYVLLQIQQVAWYHGPTHDVQWRKSCYFLPSKMKPENKGQTVEEK